MRRAALALALILALPAQAQGWGKVASGWTKISNSGYAAFPAPTGCTSGLVPYFDASLQLVCSPTVYAPTTDTTTLGTVAARNVTASALATPGAITVTPVLTQTGTINVVSGALLADGDYFTVEYEAGLTIPIEFDATPSNGTTGGRIPCVFAAGDSAGTIRDALIVLINSVAPTKVTAAIGGAAAITVTRIPVGTAGGTITENVTNAGFTVAGFADPTHATTVTYELVATLPDGKTTEAGAASSTAASVATLTAANFNRLSWSAVTGASSYAVYRTVSPTSPATTGIIYSGTALTVDDVALAGGGETAPTTNGTGVVTAGRVLAGEGTASAPGLANSTATNTGLRIGSTTIRNVIGGANILNIGTAGTYSFDLGGDLYFTRAAAATLQLGAAAANADGVDQRIQTQGGITGTDRAAGDLDLTTGLGTGTGYSKVTISAPTRVGTGTTAQTLAVKATVDDTGMTVAAGTGTATARVGGVLHVSTTAQATTGTAEEVLATYTLPANTLARDGQAVRITATATGVANTNSKTFRVRFGGIGGTIVSGTTSTTNSGFHRLVVDIVRTGAATQIASGSGTSGVTGGGAATATVSEPAQTLSGTVDIVATGTTGAAAGDLVFKSLIVEALN